MGRMVSAPRLTFSASEVGLEAFGWNIPLGELIVALRGAVRQAPVLRIMTDSVILRREPWCGGRRRYGSGERYYAEVLVAADGIESVLRTSAGIGVDRWAFDQSALVTTFKHSGPHHGVSCERHRPGGAFTTVPLAGQRIEPRLDGGTARRSRA